MEHGNVELVTEARPDVEAAWRRDVLEVDAAEGRYECGNDAHDLVGVLGRQTDQINNVLAFPGVFREALDVRATAITRETELAAAHALATVVDRDHLEADYVIPSVFDRRVAPAVAAAVAEAAQSTGVARKQRELVPALVA